MTGVLWDNLFAQGMLLNSALKERDPLSAEIRRRICPQSSETAATRAGMFWYLFLDKTRINKCILH